MLTSAVKPGLRPAPVGRSSILTIVSNSLTPPRQPAVGVGQRRHLFHRAVQHQAGERLHADVGLLARPGSS